jgi:hypothetical protein
MNRLQFSTHFRGLLGRTYSVADEDGSIDGQIRLVVLRRGCDETLLVETTESWLAGLQPPLSTHDRILLKHLAVCTQRFFAHPDYLSSGTFLWPGTPQSRARLRLALDSRKWRRDRMRAEGD